jgi:CelD/BcsL family acetyltransferase involved in cellulose biosynthesis
VRLRGGRLRYYVEMAQGLDGYRKRFSSKAMYNLRRQRRIYCESVGVDSPLVVARTPQEMKAFYDAAREVSRRTYQERLLDAGLPNHDDFHQRMMKGAAAGLVRGYLLQGKEQPMAFIYCQIEGEDVVCKYVGYDPSISKLSPGTTLLLLALEDLLAEGKFRYFDFEEGHADYKKQFSTGSVDCGSLLVLRKTVRNLAAVKLHVLVTRLSKRAGDLLDRWGIKQRIRRLLRRSA